jgi:hypothetical protein
MRNRYSFYVLITVLISFGFFESCKKENLFRSESETKKELQGTWDLLAIPKYDTISKIPLVTVVHVENWVFTEGSVEINIESQSVTLNSTYSVKTSATKAEIKIDNVNAQLFNERYNGTWRIVRLDNEFLAIANDQDGTTGLMQLEFQKR